MGIITFGIILIVVGISINAGKRALPVDARPGAWVNGVIGFGVVLIILGSIGSTVVQVPAGYRGVRLEFGAVRGVLGEGIQFVRPGVDTVELIEVRTQKEESSATAASRDLQTVTTNIALNFRVDESKADQLFKQVGKDYKSRIIDPAVQESIKVVTAQYTAEELIKNRAQVKAKVEEDITRRLRAYDLLVEPSGLSITNFAFSEEFNRAIEAKQVAQQEAEKQKYVLQQANLERQTAVARAQGQAEAAKLNALALKVDGGSLVVLREWITKWDGKLPQVAGAGNFMIDIRSLMDDAERENRNANRNSGVAPTR
jgi:regulator of protease activity HflC (stomatin/prohibitin superfamily)